MSAVSTLETFIMRLKGFELDVLLQHLLPKDVLNLSLTNKAIYNVLFDSVHKLRTYHAHLMTRGALHICLSCVSLADLRSVKMIGTHFTKKGSVLHLPGGGLSSSKFYRSVQRLTDLTPHNRRRHSKDICASTQSNTFLSSDCALHSFLIECKHITSLRTFHLEEMFIGGTDSFRLFVKDTSPWHALTTLSLCKCRLSDVDGQLLIERLVMMPGKITDLRLDDNQLTSVFVHSLCDILDVQRVNGLTTSTRSPSSQRPSRFGSTPNTLETDQDHDNDATTSLHGESHEYVRCPLQRISLCGNPINDAHALGRLIGCAEFQTIKIGSTMTRTGNDFALAVLAAMHIRLGPDKLNPNVFKLFSTTGIESKDNSPVRRPTMNHASLFSSNETAFDEDIVDRGLLNLDSSMASSMYDVGECVNHQLDILRDVIVKVSAAVSELETPSVQFSLTVENFNPSTMPSHDNDNVNAQPGTESQFTLNTLSTTPTVKTSGTQQRSVVHTQTHPEVGFDCVNIPSTTAIDELNYIAAASPSLPNNIMWPPVRAASGVLQRRQLVECNFSRVRMGSLGSAAFSLAVLKRLDVFGSLQQLWLKNNCLTDVACALLSVGLEKLSHLKTLSLAINSFSATGLKMVVRAIQKSKAPLQQLYVSQNNFSSNVADALIELPSTLRELTLDNTRAGEDGTTFDKQFDQFLQRRTSSYIRSLSMKGTHLDGSRVVNILTGSTRHNVHIKNFYFDGLLNAEGLDEANCVAIANFIENSPYDHTISLSKVDINLVGLAYIGQAVHNMYSHPTVKRPRSSTVILSQSTVRETSNYVDNSPSGRDSNASIVHPLQRRSPNASPMRDTDEGVIVLSPPPIIPTQLHAHRHQIHHHPRNRAPYNRSSSDSTLTDRPFMAFMESLRNRENLSDSVRLFESQGILKPFNPTNPSLLQSSSTQESTTRYSNDLTAQAVFDIISNITHNIKLQQSQMHWCDCFHQNHPNKQKTLLQLETYLGLPHDSLNSPKSNRSTSIGSSHRSR